MNQTLQGPRHELLALSGASADETTGRRRRRRER
jgi:hypothetical protein